ncbi:MAG: phospholipase D-like domain-containing protein [Phormidesmis sp.]
MLSRFFSFKLGSTGRQRRKLLLFALALILVVGSSIWRIIATPSPSSALQPALSPLPQDSHIQVFFNQSEASVYTDPYRHIERYGDDLEQIVVTAVDQAKTTVDVAVQALNLPHVAEALVKSTHRGVKTRLILENQYASLSSSDVDQNNALQALRAGHVLLIDDTADGSKGSGLMHNKFLVIDSQWVLTGSANLTLSGVHGDADEPASRGNANALIKINSPTLASLFTAEFNQMWGDGPGAKPDSRFGLQKSNARAGKHQQPSARRISLPSNEASSNITLQFSPLSPKNPWNESVNGLISQTLSQSKSSIDLALFVFSEQRIANQLETQSQAGTQLRVLVDPAFVYRSYSEVLDILGTTLLDQRCQLEADNRPWRSPVKTVGSPLLPPGDKLHHKFALIDGKTVIVGSHNWSDAANTKNDEALLVIENAAVAAHFDREFERLYRNALIGDTPWLQRKAQESQQRCQ